jgi:hypothetical protein
MALADCSRLTAWVVCDKAALAIKKSIGVEMSRLFLMATRDLLKIKANQNNIPIC